MRSEGKGERVRIEKIGKIYKNKVFET